MNEYVFMWAIIASSMAIGYVAGAHNVQKQWRRRMAWLYQEQTIPQQMQEDGWRFPND